MSEQKSQRDDPGCLTPAIIGARCILLLLLALLNSASPGHPASPVAQDPEQGLGLRAARRLDDRTVRLTFGASFVPAVGGHPETFRLVSPTDTRFQHGVSPNKVEVETGPDGVIPAGWAGRAYTRSRVTLHLPLSLHAGKRYWVEALGYKHQPVTGGRAAAWIETMTEQGEQQMAAKSTLGLRSLELLAPTVLLAITGDGLDAQRLDAHPELLRLESPDDPEFRNGRAPMQVGRRSRGDCFYTDGWPYGVFLKHELFLVFDRPLKPGMAYSLNFNQIALLLIGHPAASLRPDDRTTINPALKVNQVGYRPDSPKYAYLGCWMGSLGALDYRPFAHSFQVRDAASGRVVFQGVCRLRHRAGAHTETVYHTDLSGEDLYDMDFSSVTAPGEYYVTVPGCGRSFAFRIGADVYREPFRVMMNGLLHQRCGIELRSPYAQCYRPACHRARTQLTDLPRGSEAEAFQELPGHVTDPRKYDLWGGYHDAGDFDPRSHIEIAELLLLLDEIRPHAFWDGQLNLPENHNGLPDVLDAARWELDLWGRLQGADGSVRGGIEENGDPDQITVAEEDTLREFAFAPDVRASLRYAGAAAEAAILWKWYGHTTGSQEFAQRAIRAWRWAMAHGGSDNPDELVRAAIQLYRLTGSPEYRRAFEDHSVFRRLARPSLEEFGKYDQRDASFFYARCEKSVDPVLRGKIIDSFREMADSWVQAAETTAYRYLRSPYAPNTWGTGAHPIWMAPIAEAYTLTRDPKYLHWIALTCDFALGSNPMNTVFTTRLGQRPIWRPLHLLSRYCPDGPIAGIQSEGPSPRTGGSPAGSSMASWVGHSLYPAGPWPELQTYSDLTMVPEMNEQTVINQVRTAFAYGFLLPDHTALQPSVHERTE